MKSIIHVILSGRQMIQPLESSEARGQKVMVGGCADNSLTADCLAMRTERVLPDPVYFKVTAAVVSERVHPSRPHGNLSLHNSWPTLTKKMDIFFDS